jgi:hypothetical protein
MIDAAQLGHLEPADARLFEALGDAMPAYATMPTPGAKHQLRQAQLIARTLGTPATPWQNLATRIITERRIDDPRRYRWPIVVITVPRQAGKTTEFRVVQTTKCLLQPGRRAFYTAQTGKDAAARWKDLKDGIQLSPLRDSVSVRLAAGSQSLTFANGSTIAPFAPTPTSLHGYTPHDVVVDECFAFDDIAGDDLMGAIGPAQITLPDRQLILISTAGNADSTWLLRWINAARKALKDPTAEIAILEWSMPAGLDPRDPASWAFHPALGHLITTADLAEMSARHNDADWLRYYMNVWSITSEIGVFDPADLEACAAIPQKPPANRRDITLGVEIAADRSRSAILGVWDDPNTGRPAVRVVRTLAGTAGLLDAVLQLRDDWRSPIAVDDAGPTREFISQFADAIGHGDQLTHDELQRRGFHILGTKDFATGCDSLRARIREHTISLDGEDVLMQSARDAASRPMGQGWALDRNRSKGPIPEIIAAAVALRIHDTAPTPAPQPFIYVPGA